MRKRIWELDAFRGICVLGMVLVHLTYDLTALYRVVDWVTPNWFNFVQTWGGVLFLLISGISATLGRHSVRRGLVVFGSGMVITAVTVGMYLLGMANRGIIIYFGVLQCLGLCMILWPLFRKMPWWALTAIGAAMAIFGLWLMNQPPVDTYWLMPFGLPWPTFYTSDYFPIFPHLGFFLLGAALGRTVYHHKETLLPRVNEKNPLLVFLQKCGKYSLFIYLLHQPILSGVCMLLSML